MTDYYSPWWYHFAWWALVGVRWMLVGAGGRWVGAGGRWVGAGWAQGDSGVLDWLYGTAGTVVVLQDLCMVIWRNAKELGRGKRPPKETKKDGSIEAQNFSHHKKKNNDPILLSI